MRIHVHKMQVDPSKVSPNSHFVNDLSLDSLDSTEVHYYYYRIEYCYYFHPSFFNSHTFLAHFMQVVMEIENEFAVDIPDEEAFKMQSVDDVVSYILKNPMAK